MNKEKENKDIKVIDAALEHLEPFSKEEILADLEKAEKRNEKNKNNKNLGNFLKSHNKSKIKLDSKENRVAFDKDICMILKSFRQDFIPLLEVYNFLTYQGQCDALKKHFLLKGNVKEESTNNEIVEIPDEPIISINVEIIHNDSKYYSNVVKGILNMMNANFEKSYIAHHFKSVFLSEFNRYDYYHSNLDVLKKSLANDIEDINRNLDKDKLEKNKLMGTKIQKEAFISIIGKACLEDDEDLLIQIYEKSNSNDDIISNIKNLKERKYKRIIIYINEYLEFNELKKKMEKLKKDIQEQNEQMEILKKEFQEQNVQIEKLKKEFQEQNVKIEKLKKDNQEQNVQMEKLKKDNQEQKAQIEKLKEDKKVQNSQIKELKEQMKIQGEKINQLNKRVDNLEIILNALIPRKLINHCVNQIVRKNKNSLDKEI